MKKDIHPKYYQAKVTCSCGNTFTVGSTKPQIQVDICSACHPFFTGKQKYIDAEGRVERFVRKRALAAKTLAKKAKKEQKEEKIQTRPKTLKEMLKQAK